MHTKKEIHDFKVVKNQKINDEFFILELQSSKKLPLILPGQFVELLVDNCDSAFLRRPFSIHDVDTGKNIIVLLIQVVGSGTNTLSKLMIDSTVNIILPLGNSFTIPKENENVLLIGGGCGVAPLLLLVKEINKVKANPYVIIGGRNKEALLRAKEYENYANVYYTTEDGSVGQKGFVIHSPILWDDKINFSFVYSCGPEPMLKAVAKYADKTNIKCEVSLENTMACGIGACLCCVVNTNDGHKCVCTDGPVFDSKELLWQI